MMNIRLLILSTDKEYGNALGKAVSNLHREMIVRVEPLDSPYDEAVDNYDLILLECELEGFVKVKEFLFSTGRLVGLSEEPVVALNAQAEMPKDNHLWKIYKYSRVSDIVSDLKYLYSLLTGNKNFVKKIRDGNFIGFCSASANVGKSVIALSTARELAKYQDKNVLLICFDEIPATTLYTGAKCSNKRNLSDFLYYLFHRKEENICSFLESFTYRDEFGVMTFYPSPVINELRQLKEEELMFFLKMVSESAQFDYILLDLASDLSHENLFLLNYCRKLVFVQGDSAVCQYKSKMFLGYFSQINQAKLEADFIFVDNKYQFSYDQNYNDIAEQAQGAIRIEEDNGSFIYKDGYMNISIDNVFGLGIKKIVDEIVYNASVENFPL